MNVSNQYGNVINFDVAVNLMDDEIRERLANDGSDRSEQEFFEAYAEEHLKKYGSEWELDKHNPQY